MPSSRFTPQKSSDQPAYKLQGDFILRARVELTGHNQDLDRKLGWRVSSVRDADAVFVDACLYGDGVTALRFSRKKGGAIEQAVLAIKGAEILQLERRGDVTIFSAAHNGSPFSASTQVEVDLGAEVSAELFLESQNTQDKAEISFRDVRVTRPAKSDFRPYYDYIGARLEILDVYTGKLEVVHSSPEAFEAPNWMLDGRTIIYNVSGPGPGKGVLRTFDLETGIVAPLDTAFATNNNNDHVLSFDNRQLAISHFSADDDGRSVIYTLPATGGVPKRVTPNSPSFLHGWSTDAQWLTYTGGRRLTPGGPEKFDIYKIPSAGGAEIRLTDSPGLNDGPEFSPDGRYIYFNSTRSGLMQLWRMKTDGSEQEQVTNDEFNNWFPHISPDGKWIVFLSFNQDVKPEDHPYYRHVYIRLMPISGGQPKVIAYVYGGQGTINVPSWSPDSRRIAFVSNTDVV